MTTQQPYSATQHKQSLSHSNNLSISETAKNPNTERNLVEEYRQKLKSKLNESANNQSLLSKKIHRPESYQDQNNNLPNQTQSQSQFSGPMSSTQPLRLSPNIKESNKQRQITEGATNRTVDHNYDLSLMQQNVIESIKSKYTDQLTAINPPLGRSRDSPPPIQPY